MTNQSFWNINLGRDPKIRAADADRETTAEQLRRAHADGRLDTAELQERLERCYEAKSLGDLEELITDLPRDAAERSSASPSSLWRWRLTPLVPILIALIAVCAITGDHAFWILVPVALLVYRMCWWRRRPWRMTGRRGPGSWV